VVFLGISGARISQPAFSVLGGAVCAVPYLGTLVMAARVAQLVESHEWKLSSNGGETMYRTWYLLFATFVYLIFFATFLYLPLFVADLFVPKTINSGNEGNLFAALAVNLGLLSAFAVQHTIMARPAFKSWWTKWVPESIERSVFVLAASVILILTFIFWQPMTAIVWKVDNIVLQTVLWTLFFGGFFLALYSSLLIDHFELFGLRQAWNAWRGVELPPPEFQEKSLYRYVRHPLMSGLLLMVWSAPTMTVGRLFFNLVITLYVFVGTALEERDLQRYLGQQYVSYRERTPMFVPFLHWGTGNREAMEA
jgi:protein-S-isoprenylcysteine O-methyltransferase Ste14